VPGMPSSVQNGTAFVLLALVLLMNFAATWIRRRFRRRRPW
jgi:ABC-type phosphate transport system permease subunit